MPRRYNLDGFVFHDEYGKRIIDEGFGVIELSQKSKKVNKGGLFDKFKLKWKKQ